MPILDKSQFIFVVCQVGAEPALKKEIGREHPDLKFAFSRPGFITFKSATENLPLDFCLRSVFARSYGLSMGKLGPKEGTQKEKAEQILKWIEQRRSSSSNAIQPCLHIWERDQYQPGEEPLGFKAGVWRDSAVQAFQTDLPINQPAKNGDLVFDVILVEEDEWWCGVHQHNSDHSAFPGGNPIIPLHPDAPSRAYVKFEEALLWSGAPIRSGDVAVEVGSAPGGASFSMLQRGLSVVGIDPAKMDPIVARSKSFQHIQRPVASVLREELPETVHWFLMDMNVAPAVSIFAVDRLATRLRESLLGVLLTVKLNQWKLADEIPSILEHVRVMGMAQVKATQLPSNRQEIFIYGITRKGLARKQRRIPSI